MFYNCNKADSSKVKGAVCMTTKIMETNPHVAKSGDQITKIVGHISQHRKTGGGGDIR